VATDLLGRPRERRHGPIRARDRTCAGCRLSRSGVVPFLRSRRGSERRALASKNAIPSRNAATMLAQPKQRRYDLVGEREPDVLVPIACSAKQSFGERPHTRQARCRSRAGL